MDNNTTISQVTCHDDINKNVDNIIRIQKLLDVMILANILDTKIEIKSTSILKTYNGILNVLSLINTAIIYKPRNRKNYWTLLKYIINDLKGKITIHEKDAYDNINDHISFYYLYKAGIVKLPPKKYVTEHFRHFFLNEYQGRLKSAFTKLFHSSNMNQFSDFNQFYGHFQIFKIIKKNDTDEFIYYIESNSLDLEIQFAQEFINETFPYFGSTFGLIEYAVYWKSNAIFKYLLMSKVMVSDLTMKYAILSINIEAIHILEDKNIKFAFEHVKIAISTLNSDLIEYVMNNCSEEIIDLSSYRIKKFNAEEIMPRYQHRGIWVLLQESIIFNNMKFFIDNAKLNLTYQNIQLCVKLHRLEMFSIAIEQNSYFYDQIDKFTIAQFLILRKRTEFLRVLLSYEIIDINKQSLYLYNNDYFTTSALHIAVIMKDIDIVKQLLNVKGINVNIQDTHSRTPLHFACIKRSTDIINLLLNQPNINVNIKGGPITKVTPVDETIVRYDMKNTKSLWNKRGRFSYVSILKIMVDLLIFALICAVLIHGLKDHRLHFSALLFYFFVKIFTDLSISDIDSLIQE
ncbi:hypothetical protein TRFO_08338 [Tritrichomonas foetus]|uniref:Uncharacterized protein n=1 Tax=Tritrichomonas foetus TaxID=1144522 RepID=A0A1J4JLX2_9EUKA|nr:hypothetical protein TRFO_08338 [Tritrichomonas foetus]|eukprot:OHS99689.1 hypothetical protein TRFO_08338 [Tritrichomonas foetus]